MQSKTINYKPVLLVLLFVIGFSILILLKLNGSRVIFSDSPALKVGRLVPDFAYPGLDGKMVQLSDFRGKVVLVNIWATWCRPCIDEMPSMEKLYQEFKDGDFEILAVSIDALGADVVTPFMQKYNLTFPALIDKEGKIRISYGVTGIPESFIIDQNGGLVKKIIGAADWSSVEVLNFFQNLIQPSQ